MGIKDLTNAVDRNEAARHARIGECGQRLRVELDEGGTGSVDNGSLDPSYDHVRIDVD